MLLQLRLAERLGDELSDAERLAEQFVDTEQLNLLQAKQLLKGQTRFHLGQYRIIDSLGQGGMGQVFHTRHTVSTARWP